MRPFYPGGDYRRFAYEEGSIVVDNPPFSILSEIVRFYDDNNIGFFLFAQAKTLFSIAKERRVCRIAVNPQVIYENGANVDTAFITSLDNCAIRTAPELQASVDAANPDNMKTASLPRYEYPRNVITPSRVAELSKIGVSFMVDAEECESISALDEQKKEKKGIYGNGFLISEDAAERFEAAMRILEEKKKPKVWRLFSKRARNRR